VSPDGLVGRGRELQIRQQINSASVEPRRAAIASVSEEIFAPLGRPERMPVLALSRPR
jgi:hypothetical protein